GDNDSGYTVEGLFGDVVEDFANTTVAYVYDSIFERNSVGDDLMRFFLDREVGDYVYDVMTAYVLKGELGEKLDFVGFANTRDDETGHYVLTKNVSEVLGIVLDFNVYGLIKSGDKVAYLKDEISELKVGDVVYDAVRTLLNKEFNIDEPRYAYENKVANEFVMDKNLSEVLNIVYNAKVLDVIDGISKDAVGYLKTTFASVEVGDVLFDVIRKVTNGKFGTKATFAHKHVEANENRYELTNVVLEVLFNINIVEFINEGDKVTYLKNKAGEIYLGDVAGLFADITGVEEDWTYNGEELNYVIGCVFGIQVKDIFRWIDEQTSVLEIVEEVFGNVRIANFVEFAGKVEKATNAQGIEVYSFNGAGVPLLVSDIMALSVSEIIGVKDAGDIFTAIVELVFNTRTVENYLKDYKLDVLDAQAFDGIAREYTVAEHITNFRNDALSHLKAIVSKVHVGDIASFAPAISGEEGLWMFNGDRLVKIISDLMDITGGEIFNWIDANDKLKVIVTDVFKNRTFKEYVEEFNVAILEKAAFEKVLDEQVAKFILEVAEGDVEYLKGVVGDIYVGEIIGIFADVEPMPTTFALGNVGEVKWAINGKEAKLILSDLFTIQISDIFRWIGANDKVNTIVSDIFGGRTVEDYIVNFGADQGYIDEHTILHPIVREYTIAGHVYELTKDAVAHL
ncbi:MAG: hypothetical protein IKB66_05310, partial [Clostridia bacterium]|nr:hypothetical protein [Clostridia bacterium]